MLKTLILGEPLLVQTAEQICAEIDLQRLRAADTVNLTAPARILYTLICNRELTVLENLTNLSRLQTLCGYRLRKPLEIESPNAAQVSILGRAKDFDNKTPIILITFVDLYTARIRAQLGDRVLIHTQGAIPALRMRLRHHEQRTAFPFSLIADALTETMVAIHDKHH